MVVLVGSLYVSFLLYVICTDCLIDCTGEKDSDSSGCYIYTYPHMQRFTSMLDALQCCPFTAAITITFVCPSARGPFLSPF
jgi:hypothetical protein